MNGTGSANVVEPDFSKIYGGVFMRKKFFQLILFALVLLTAGSAFAKETPDQLRAKLNDMSQQVLTRMYEKYP